MIDKIYMEAQEKNYIFLKKQHL